MDSILINKYYTVRLLFRIKYDKSIQRNNESPVILLYNKNVLFLLLWKSV